MTKICGDWEGMKTFALQVLKGRWFSVFASLLIMAVAGTSYMFGLYSSAIKASLGYDQTTLNLLSFFKDFGSNVGILAGLINEIAPPWVILSIGIVMNFFGYFMIWLAVTGHISKPPVWQMCIYIYIGANSQSFANTGALVTCVKNFPESRGSLIGLLKGYVGLSGAIIAQLFHALYGDETKSLILLIAWLPAAVSLIFLRTVRYMKVIRQTNELKVLCKFLYIALGLAGFLMILIIIQSRIKFTQHEYIGPAVVVLILLFLPLAIVITEETKLLKSKKQTLGDSSDPTRIAIEQESQLQLQEPLEQREAADKKRNPDSCFKGIFSPPERGEDYTILQALFSIDMIIIFIATIFGAGGTLTAIDNLGQIGKSLGYPSRSITTFISLVSIWNFLGRVIAGFASEALLIKYHCPRPLLLTLVLLLSCVGHLLIVYSVPYALYFVSVIIGFCFGAQWPLIFAIISEIFGLKYYSTLYNFGALASPIGAYILNVKLTGSLYDKEALKQMKTLGLSRKPGEELNCTGGHCFRVAFIIITVATLGGCLISLILVIRTRRFYKSDIYKKFREEAEQNKNVKVPEEMDTRESTNVA